MSLYLSVRQGIFVDRFIDYFLHTNILYFRKKPIVKYFIKQL